MNIDCLPSALDLASRGFTVFPCIPGLKKPATLNGLKDASADPAVIRAWWEENPNANLAIATEGLVVIDIDIDPEKDRAQNPWLKDRPDLMAELEAAPTAVTPRGGRHYFFRAGAERLRNSASQVALGVDVRADGGYVLVAPSRTERGIYRFERPLPASVAQLPQLPGWLEVMILAVSKKARTAVPATPETGPVEPADKVVEGGRNSHLTSIAGALRRRGLDSDEIGRRLLKVNDRQCSPPLDAAEVLAIASSVATYPAGPSAPSESMPEVLIGPDEHRVNTEVVRALAADVDLYERGGRLVRVVPKGGPGPAAGGLVIQEIEQATVREIISRRVNLVKLVKDEIKTVHPPAWTVAAVHARSHWPGVRYLHAVSESPVLRADGTVVETPGYDPVTGVLYLPTGEFPRIAEGVAQDDADAAVEALYEVVEDFTFESEVHKSAWLALVLTAVGRHAFDGPAPLFLIDANVRGAGKTLLAQAAAVIALGHVVGPTSYCHDTEEMRKQISTTALEGEPFVLFDNLAGVLGNDALDRALTGTRWRDRRLGGNTKVDAPLVTTWAATGNNVAIEADTARRTVHIRLCVDAEHPEDREGFKHPDLLGYVKSQRPRLLMAAMTVLGVYLREGCPDMRLRPMGSYEDWSRVVRGAIAWTGRPDPCLGRDGFEVMSDSAAETGRMLIGAWKAYDPKNHGLVVTTLVRTLYPPGAPMPGDTASVNMRAALEQLVGGNRAPSSRVVGNKLRSLRERVHDGWCLVCDSKSALGKVWRLRQPGGSAGVILVTVPEPDLESGEEVDPEAGGQVPTDPEGETGWFTIPGD